MFSFLPRALFATLLGLLWLITAANLNAAPPAQAPVNDNFFSATLLNTASGFDQTNTTFATKEAWESGHASNAGGHSIWYIWTAPASGFVTFDTVGSTFDTVLAVYTWSGSGPLVPVAANDNANNSFTSAVSFQASAGTRYYVALDGANGASGQSVLRWSQGSTAAPPQNDAFWQAQAIVGNTGQVRGTNVGATIESGWEQNRVGATAGGSVWYKWTGSASGFVKFDTSGSAFDTWLLVWIRANDNWLGPTIDDNSAGNGASRAEVPMQAGAVYYVGVYGTGTNRGDFVLNWSASAAPGNDVPTSEPPSDITGDLGDSTANPGTASDLTGSSGTPVLSPQFLQAGSVRQANNVLNMPLWLYISFVGFTAGNIQVQVVRPDGVKYPIQTVANTPGGWLYALPWDAPTGIYTMNATQGTLRGSLKFQVNDQTPEIGVGIQPMPLNFMVDPAVRRGQSLYIYVAGFPRSATIRLNAYRDVDCGGPTESLRRCYRFWRTWTVRTNANGRGAYHLATRANDPVDYYLIVADHPALSSTEDPRARFRLE